VAESHVDNSIKNPGVFIQTNVTGTFTLIDVAYKHWMDKPFTYKERYETATASTKLRSDGHCEEQSDAAIQSSVIANKASSVIARNEAIQTRPK